MTGRADGWIFSVLNSCRESWTWFPLEGTDRFPGSDAGNRALVASNPAQREKTVDVQQPGIAQDLKLLADLDLLATWGVYLIASRPESVNLAA
jgi:hypothetical protein